MEQFKLIQQPDIEDKQTEMKNINIRQPKPGLRIQLLQIKEKQDYKKILQNPEGLNYTAL